jgi:hypothetical protein
MKFFSAGLTFVNVATIAGLILGILGGGLDEGFAGLALFLGIVAAVFAWLGTTSFSRRKVVMARPPPSLPKSKRARRRMKLPAEPKMAPAPRPNYHLWAWAVGIVFALFAIRSFCWLLWIDGNHFKIQSSNNLGDLALHISYMQYFAHGVPLWPDNPIHVFSKLRYPAGIDLFDSLFLLLHGDLIRALVWTGLLGSLATFYAFYRWGGAFAVAGFLFNGGLAGFEFFQKFQFADYQGERIAWKSIPLTMFVTQRGLLYAIPAGLLLLLHWRRKYYPTEVGEAPGQGRGLVPWWVEWSIYSSMPLFHVHTFLALSALLAFWLLIGTWEMRKQIALLFGAAFLPATWIVWMITDHFQAKSILAWAPGWLQSDPGFSDSALKFWVVNFGLMLPAMIALLGVVVWQSWKKVRPPPAKEATEETEGEPNARAVSEPRAPAPKAEVRRSLWRDYDFSPAFAFVVPAAFVFLFALFVKTAPWGWDNTKLMIWSYFICLPFLWRELIVKWPVLVRAAVCFLLFTSGFVSLMGGLKAGSPGFDIANRTELDAVAAAVKPLPIRERFAAFPTYNHPLLMAGRKVVLGYGGHLWTQGFDYAPIEQELRALMLGAPGWRERARALRARYLFWGEEEKRAYASSAQPWREQAAVVASGFWGTIYDLERTRTPDRRQ